MKILIITSLTLLTLTSCFWDPSFSYEIKKPYYLGVDYGTNQVCLHWTETGGPGGIEKIPSMIKEIGWNEKYIIAEQESVFNKGKISFFIIDMDKDEMSCYDCPIGPLTKEEYLRIRDSLGIPKELNFKLEINHFDVKEIKTKE